MTLNTRGKQRIAGYSLGVLLLGHTIWLEPDAVFFLQRFFKTSSASSAEATSILTFFFMAFSSIAALIKPEKIIQFLDNKNAYMKIAAWLFTALAFLSCWHVKTTLYQFIIPPTLPVIFLGYTLYQSPLLVRILKYFTRAPYWDYLITASVFIVTLFPYLAAWTTGHIETPVALYRISGLLLLAPVFALLIAKGWYKILLGFQFVLFLVLQVLLFYLLTYERDVGESTYLVIFNTYPKEILEFVRQYVSFNIHLVVYPFLFLVTSVLIIQKRKQIQSHRAAGLIMVGWVGILVWLINIPEGKSDILRRNVFANMAETYVQYAEMVTLQHDYLEKINQQLEPIKIDNPYDGREVHVMIIGESTSTTNMGLYGYHRDTTPRLSALHKSGEVFVFTDVISPHSHTLPVFKQLFSFSNREHEDSTFKHGLLPQYLRAAGYKTYWLSNQPLYAFWGSPEIGAIADTCDYKEFISDGQHVEYDDKLLPLLEKTLNSGEKKQFIFLHLMGTHSSYAHRFPASMKVLSTDTLHRLRPDLDDLKLGVLNNYDNSIHFTDYVVDSVIERIKKTEAYASIVFVSDHGEDVFVVQDRASHAETMGTYPMFQIPLVLWFSPKFHQANQARVQELSSYLNRPYMTDDLIHSILDLLDIRAENFDATRSLFNKSFTYRPRILEGIGDYDIERESFSDLVKTRNRFLDSTGHREKLWVHRVNSIEKLHDVSTMFSGVELDLVFLDTTKTFDITHPPVESIGLNLDDYWKSLENPEKLGYWLDIKNLSIEFAAPAHERLVNLVETYRIPKNRILVESKHPEALSSFTDSGFMTSYYLPTSFMQKIQSLTEKEISPEDQDRIDEIIAKVDAGNVSGVSFDKSCEVFVDTYLPHVKNKFVWGWGDIFNAWTRKPVLEFLERVPETKIVLIKQPSKYER